jgi:hypothetical protein
MKPFFSKKLPELTAQQTAIESSLQQLSVGGSTQLGWRIGTELTGAAPGDSATGSL